MATASQAIDDSSASVFLNDSVWTAPTKPAIPRTAPKNTSPLRERVAALINSSQAETDLDQAERGGVSEAENLHNWSGHRTVEATADDGDEAGYKDHQAGDAGDDRIRSETRCVGSAHLAGRNRCRCDDLSGTGATNWPGTGAAGDIDHGRRLLNDNVAALVEGTFGERHVCFSPLEIP